MYLNVWKQHVLGLTTLVGLNLLTTQGALASEAEGINWLKQSVNTTSFIATPLQNAHEVNIALALFGHNLSEINLANLTADELGTESLVRAILY